MWRCFITAGIMTYDFDAPRHWSDREYPYQSHLRCVRRPGDNIIPGRERTSRKYRVTTLTVELDEDDVSQQFFVMDVSEDILGSDSSLPTPESTPTSEESINKIQMELEQTELVLRLEKAALEQRQNIMKSFRFSTDPNIHLDEAKNQIKTLYPKHNAEELQATLMKTSAAIGAKDLYQARQLMLDPMRPFYMKNNYQQNN
eukprot:GHVP01068964.1.p1 GENE.GHVP01068964.1~~GHVP01068964.1.p1  ORF type:complete len:201 (+),score=22.95 GHVP01068964.1:434-1036(+)